MIRNGILFGCVMLGMVFVMQDSVFAGTGEGIMPYETWLSTLSRWG